MTLYATPGGTPLNTTPFQGTQPGNAVGATLSPLNPGVGLFPPNSNNASGDSPIAAAARAALPLNVNLTNFGATAHAGQGPNNAGGRAVLETFSDCDENGASSAFTANGGSATMAMAGSNSASGAAGGLNQTNAPSGGEAIILPANAPMTVPAISSPNVFRG